MGDIAKRRLGRTDVSVTELGFGGAPLGELFEPVSEEEGQRTLQAAWDAGVRYFDTAPFYGFGKSEHRIGRFLRGQPRREFVLSTKVGRVFQATRDLDRFDRGSWVGGLPFEFAFDYSYDGIMRSYEDSLQRLGLHAADLLLIHDLDRVCHATDERVNAYMTQILTSGWRALDELRSSGQIRGVGAGLNLPGMIPRFLDHVAMDFFIVAMPYTLLDQKVLDAEFPRCVEQGVGVVIGSVFASGVLATGPVEGARYAYGLAPAEVLEKTRRIEAVCRRRHVPLPAAALQFPLAHPAVAAVIPGAFKPEHVQSNAQLLRHPIPPDLWADLKAEGLLREDAPTP
ncbi:MAG: aldo/keto reductase [Candidatus Latescibacteria bacterium]|nr:aldo/keto reductase [Candidatus Latescibacterota bacterium]